MYKYLLDIIKKIEGNVVCVGLDYKLLEGFNKNNHVSVYTIEKAKPGFGVAKKKKRITSSGKTINIKKLYKYFKKNSIDYIFCDSKEINEYIKYFIRDSVFLSNKKIYLYGNKEEFDTDLFKKRYKRYKSIIEIKTFKDNILFIIDTSKKRNNWILNKLYFIKDTLYNLVDFISNVLTS